MFFLLFTVFHYYLFSFPFGFNYVGIGVTALGMLLLMHVFFYKFELEAARGAPLDAGNPGSVRAGPILVRRQPASPAREGRMPREIVYPEPNTANDLHQDESSSSDGTSGEAAFTRGLSHPLAREAGRPETHGLSIIDATESGVPKDRSKRSLFADLPTESAGDALAHRSPAHERSPGTNDSTEPFLEEPLTPHQASVPDSDGEMQAAEPSAEKALPRD